MSLIRTMSRLIDRCIASPLAVMSATVLWVALPMMFFVKGLPSLSQYISHSIPVAYEKKLGEFVLAQFSLMLAREPSTESSARQIRLQRRFTDMAQRAQLPEARLLIRSGPVNAVALPGNTIVLMDGLLRYLDDDQVMAVVAHELGHLHHRHVMQRIVSVSLLEGAVEGIAGGNSQAARVGSVFSSAVLNSAYSRAQELEADTYAIELLKANGDSGLAYVQALQFFLSYEKQQGVISGGWVNSHPSTQERLDRAMNQAGGVMSTLSCRFEPQSQPPFTCQ
jgi:Zn-dependent protease with chaperone function